MVTMIVAMVRTRLMQSAAPSTVTLREGFAATTSSVSLAGASVTETTTAAMVLMKTITISVCVLFFHSS